MHGLALFISVFLAAAVECVEAVTIVLAAGTARHWKSALQGTLAAFLLLGGIIAIGAPYIPNLPMNALRLFVGTLLLVFGLQWMRKAILRSSGYKALHDEDKIFKDEFEAAKKVAAAGRFGVVDWYAFTLSFKGVLLEGLEVAFIVLTFGSIQNQVGLASYAALSAAALVAAAGFALRKPLARVPENTLKFIVGIMLTAFGIFWAGEGAGAEWPTKDLAILMNAAFLLVISYTLIAMLKSRKAKAKITVSAVVEFDELDAETVLEDSGIRKVARDFAFFWYDFLIGDDLIGTAIVLAGLQATYLLTHSGTNAWWLMPIAVAILLPVNLFRVTR